MSDKVKYALDHASSLRFPENVLADEVRRLTAALSEAQRERDALKGEVERLRREKADLLDTKPRRDRMFDAEAWDGAMDALGKMAAERDALKGEVESWKAKYIGARQSGYAEGKEGLDAAVKRAEEAERTPGPCAICGARCRNSEHPLSRAWNQWQDAESKLALAERVVEALQSVAKDLGAAEWGDPRDAETILREIIDTHWTAARAAVAEYRKAIGKVNK